MKNKVIVILSIVLILVLGGYFVEKTILLHWINNNHNNMITKKITSKKLNEDNYFQFYNLKIENSFTDFELKSMEDKSQFYTEKTSYSDKKKAFILNRTKKDESKINSTLKNYKSSNYNVIKESPKTIKKILRNILEDSMKKENIIDDESLYYDLLNNQNSEKINILTPMKKLKSQFAKMVISNEFLLQKNYLIVGDLKGFLRLYKNMYFFDLITDDNYRYSIIFLNYSENEIFDLLSTIVIEYEK